MVEALVPLPNPNPAVLKVRVQGRADALRLKLWSPAYTLVDTMDFNGPLGPGWVTLPLRGQDWVGLGNGLYFLTLEARRGIQAAPKVPPARVILLR